MLNNMSNTEEAIKDNIRQSIPEGFGKAMVDAILSAQTGINNPPYANCSFKMCDLPGVCTGHGRCHHPDELTLIRNQLQVAVESLEQLDGNGIAQQALTAIAEMGKPK